MIPLLYYAVLGIVLWATYGMFNPLAVIILSLSTLAFLLLAPRKKIMEGNLPLIASIIIAAFLMLLLQWPGLMYFSKEPPLSKVYSVMNLSIGLGAVVFAIWWMRFTLLKRESVLPLVAFWILAYAYFLVISAVPLPKIDVFIIDSIAADHMMAGSNPYSVVFPDYYNGAYGFIPGFTYWPAYLYASLPARIAGDIRLAHCAALLFCAWGLYRLNKASGGSRTESQLTVLLLASFPAGLFVLEQAWVDTLLSAFAIAVAVLLHANRWFWAGIISGLAVATKQYGFLIAIPTIAFALRVSGWKASVLTAAGTAVAAMAMFLPFVIWDWSSFYKNTIELIFKMPNRPDSLSLPALYFQTFHAWPPGALLLLLYLAALGGSIAYLFLAKNVQLAHWAYSIVAVHAVIFLMGKQAFCNYYYLLATLVLLLFAIRRQWVSGEPAKP